MGDWFCFVFDGGGGAVGNHQPKRSDLCNQ